EDTNCLRVLRAEVNISLQTTDGQLDVDVPGTVTALRRNRLVLEADVEPKHLHGMLQVSDDVNLRLESSVDGDKVEGVLTAFSSGGSGAKRVTLATWEGTTT